jgi:hypothetical protein
MKEVVKKVSLVEPIDVETIRVKRYPLFKDAYVIDLPLTEEPNYIWRIFFEQEVKSSLHLWERKIVIVGRTLKLITTPTRIREKIEWLKKVIEKTNSRIDEYNKALEEARKAEEAIKRVDEEAMKRIRDEIRWVTRR